MMAPQTPKRLRSIQDLQNTFIGNWFPGGDAFPEQIIKLHDSAHQWSNVNPMSRGELQQQIVDVTGAQLLEQTLGAQGFVNATTGGASPITAEALQGRIDALQEASREVEKRSLFGESALGETINSPARFLFPALEANEIKELQKRGREFYGQVGQNYIQQIQAGRIPETSGTQLTELKFTPQPNVTVDFPVNPRALAIHENPNLLKVKGGYDVPGKLSYGPIKQFMNSPLEIMVDAPDWGYAGREYLTKETFPAIQEMYPGNTANQIQKRIKEREKYSGKYGGIIIDDLGELEYITNRAKIPSNYSKEQFAADYKGFDPTQVQSGSDKDFDRYVQYIKDQDRAMRGYSLEPDDAYYKRLENEQLKGFNVQANELPYKPTTYTAAKHGFSGNDTEFTQSSALANPSLQRAYNKLFAIAKNRGSLRNIIKGATTAIGDIGGSVPLFDPEFRQAVEKGDAGKATVQVAKEYGAGLVAAPVIGMGVGALNQVAPRAARVVAGGLNVARAANPIAVVSQLGGSSKINPAANKKAIEDQFRRAEVARKRGGKWKFPTPFGNLTIPEFGISEAGGLFFR
jgi:hypothetical protein